MTPLPARQQQLYDLLAGKGDVRISDLYAMMGGPLHRAEEPRYAQQWLGKYITLLNRRLEARGLKVEPGELKGSYRLTVIA